MYSGEQHTIRNVKLSDKLSPRCAGLSGYFRMAGDAESRPDFVGVCIYSKYASCPRKSLSYIFFATDHILYDRVQSPAGGT